MSKPSTERFGKFKIRALTFGDVNKINSDAISLTESGVSLDVGKVRFLTLKLGIVEPEMSDEQINDLPESVANELYLKILSETGGSLSQPKFMVGA